MKQETRIRNALITLYWDGHEDGRICAYTKDGMVKHITEKTWSDRRAKVIHRALQALGLPNTASTRQGRPRVKKVK